MTRKKIFHINDRSMKYKSAILSRYQHKYLRLPGTYKARYPQEIVFPNMEYGRADEYYSTEEGLMINLEEESDEIGDATLRKISNYVINSEFMYSMNSYSAVICHKDPKKPFEYYERSPSVIIKVHYIYFKQEDLWKKYENLIKKIEQREELSEDESMDLAFIPKFISKEHGQFVTESLANRFKNAIIRDKHLRIHIGVILEAMILKHFDSEEKINELKGAMHMEIIENELEILAREHYAEEYKILDRKMEKVNSEYEKAKLEKEKLETENGKLEKENGKLREDLEKIKKIGDLRPEIREIVNQYE